MRMSICARGPGTARVCAAAFARAAPGSGLPAVRRLRSGSSSRADASGSRGSSMSQYSAKISWARGGANFIDNRYSRAHSWQFDGGVDVPASASPHVVPVPMSVEAAVDPEEAFVAAIASCHMLWFLSLAAAQHLCVDSYVDDAVGVLGKNAA